MGENLMYYLLGMCMGAMVTDDRTLFIAICVSIIILGLIMTHKYNDI